MKNLFLIFVLLLGLMSSCKTIQPLTDTSSHHTTDQKSLEKDSVYMYVRDSVTVFIKGDTMIKEHFRTEYRDRFRDRFDTLKITDTVQRKQIQYIKAKTSFNGWQWFQIWCGRILLILIVILLGRQLIKRYLKRI